MKNNNNNRSKLEAAYHRIADIDVHDIRQMYAVYSQYYDNTTWDIFLRDLSKKTGAFLVRKVSDGRVVGFSTLMNCDVQVGRKQVRALFSGDTVIERAYWGSRALQFAFYKHLIAEKVRNPRRPIYWLLISKGYKTYLLLANNFYNFYPRPDRHDDHLADIVDAYCEQMFPDYYNAEKGILDFGADYQPLRSDVAEISDRMLLESPGIRFFQERNPEWRRGTELPCLGEITWACMAKFAARYLTKPISKGAAEAAAVVGKKRGGLITVAQEEAAPALSIKRIASV